MASIIRPNPFFTDWTHGPNFWELWDFLPRWIKIPVYPALDRLLSDDYELEDRMMLEGKIYRGEELIGKDIALNDIVIGREGHLRVIRFRIMLMMHI
mgnify:CR=1 FL=1